MGISKSKYYEYKEFSQGEFSSFVNKLAKKHGVYPHCNPINVHSYNKVLDAKQMETYQLNQFPDYCKFCDKMLSISIKLQNGDISFSTNKFKDKLFFMIGISANDPGNYCALHDDVITILSLEEIPDPFHSNDDANETNPEHDIETIIRRISAIEDRIAIMNNRMSCFISYRFNNKMKNVVTELIRFLQLLDVDATTGSGYEPRKISEKVQQRLQNEYNFFIYVVASEGDSTWMKQELGMAYMKELPIVILVEDSITFEPGILGDWEYIPLNTDHVGDSFIAIIEALHYIKQTRKIEEYSLSTI